jgi:hypothetical protein
VIALDAGSRIACELSPSPDSVDEQQPQGQGCKLILQWRLGFSVVSIESPSSTSLVAAWNMFLKTLRVFKSKNHFLPDHDILEGRHP